jgi:LacI family transcriptional regulator
MVVRVAAFYDGYKKMTEIKKVVLLINPDRAHTRGLVNGIIRYAGIQGDWTFYRPIESRMSKTKRLLSTLKEMQPDGILMRQPPEMAEIIKLGIPIVAFIYSQEKFPGIVNVVTDGVSVGKMAAEHLIRCGFRDFGFCGYDDWWWSMLRGEVFAEAITQAGYKTYFYKLPRAKTNRVWHKEVHVVADWLKTLPKPIGIMAANDDRGEMVLEACKIAGLRVPDDVAVLGVDNDEIICNLSTPSLSSIVMGVEKGGYEGASLLNTMMKEKKPREGELVVKPIQVIQRQSTDVLAIDDREVVEAIRFIRNHATNSIQVDDIVNHVSLSRRVLEKRFRKILRHSIRDEIQHTRTDKIIYLLFGTNMTISEISQTTGFSSVANFSRYFCQAKGISPAAYRKQYIET